jgi:hypothetical protein
MLWSRHPMEEMPSRSQVIALIIAHLGDIWSTAVATLTASYIRMWSLKHWHSKRFGNSDRTRLRRNFGASVKHLSRSIASRRTWPKPRPTLWTTQPTQVVISTPLWLTWPRTTLTQVPIPRQRQGPALRRRSILTCSTYTARMLVWAAPKSNRIRWCW